jgi:hypothetical protein
MSVVDNLKQSMTRHIVSPLGLATVSYGILLVAWSFPPDVYADYVGETDRMYLNWQLLSFYTCCVTSFFVGYYIYRCFSGQRQTVQAIKLRGEFACLSLCVPVVLSSAACVIFLIKLGGRIDFVAMLAAHQGQSIKTAGMAGELVSGGWGSTVVVLTAVLWWAMYRFSQVTLTRLDRLVFYGLFGIGVFVDLLVCAATVDRTSLMPVAGGLFIIHLFRKTSGTHTRLASVLPIVCSVFATLGALFLGVSLLRGASAFKLLVASLLGYSIVSYNRLASLLAGTMSYTYGGRGAYLFPLAVRNDRLNSIIPFRSHFGWPSGDAQFLSEFVSVSAAGLNPTYIWSGTFGYIYSDIGWWCLLYLTLLGILAGYLWFEFRSGSAVGVIAYLWLAFSILFWMGGNYVFHERVVRFVTAGIVLSLYDKVVFTHRAPAPPAIAAMLARSGE